ncbi:MAG: isoprenyl transferase [Clostridiales bacterium]|nr:isoprenyl transferase [Clostridiales bacterium]
MSEAQTLPQFSVLPRHVGFIMDGNGRWAKKRGLPRSEGHKAGAKNFRKIGEYAADLGIEYVTFYAFSTENWKRPDEEVNALMELFSEYLNEVIDRIGENEEKGIHLKFIGDKNGLSDELLNLMDYTEKLTEDKKKVTLNIAINYGGRHEIACGVKEIARKVSKGELSPEDIDENLISDFLYTKGQPDPDLIIRPSGEYRLSNFLTWQGAYSELWFSDILWPDFSTDDFNEALRAFEHRHRRFGGI